MTACNADYAQIATFLRGQYRVLKSPDDHALAQMNTIPSGPTREEFTAASTFPEAVTTFLYQLDMKVDALLAGMQHSALELEFPHRMEITSISASCLDFTAKEPLAPGDWLEIIINFRQMGVFTASGIGTITARNVAEDGTPVFTLTFSRILEEEREKIIRYVFQEERRLLRKTRLEQD